MTLPSFICIGSPKCGTTTLSSVLGQLDRICHPACLGNKEVDYFTLRKGNFIKGLDWYEANFSHCQKDQLAGDFSPSYFSDPDSAEELPANVDLSPANTGASNRFRFLYVLLKKIKSILRRIGFNWLSNMLVRNGFQDFFIKWNSIPPEQLPSDLYAELSDYFKEHDRRLCELIQRQELPWQDKTK